MSSPNIYDNARGRWPEILAHFGIDARYLTGQPGPCPLCKDGKDRFTFDDIDGMGTFVCRQCRGRNGKALAGRGMELLMRFQGWPWKTALSEVRSYLGIKYVKTGENARPKRPWFERVWEEALPVDPKDPVSRYLSSRGLEAALSMLDPEVVRCHPGLTYFGKNKERLGQYPAMVASIHNPSGQRVSAHVTYLTPEGQKAPVTPARKILPSQRPLDGGAIRLGGVQPTKSPLGLAEGLETALAAGLLFGMTVWSCLNTSILAKWDPPQDAPIESVVLFGDHDPHFAGHASLYALACSLSKRHVVRIDGVRFPKEPGWDWNDVLMEVKTREKGSGT